jgi:hypothetical protein
MNLNIFVIHHAPISKEFFDTCIEVKKTNGFSDITYVEEF